MRNQDDSCGSTKTGSTGTRTSKTRTNNWTWRARAGWTARTLALALLLLGGLACATAPRAATPPADQRPIVILISLDGWRHDYLARAEVPTLRALAAQGVRSEGLIPAFPSKTFPNHYTIVTGLYPQNHGIVSNTMLDPAIGPDRFTMSSATAKDSRWWGGEPLWVTAEKQGQRSASMFWPGSEVEVGGVRPSHWKPYEDAYPHRDRVNQVLDWLKLPVADRPTFITLYFSEVDTVGHNAGPDSPLVLEAAARLDAEVAALTTGVRALGLDALVHYVIVSDHGMSQLSNERVIVLDDYLDMNTVTTLDGSPVIGLSPRTGSADDIVAALKGKHPQLSVYKREDMPEHLHYRTHSRIPPVIAMVADGWTLASRTQVLGWQKDGRVLGGAHGYDTNTKSMQGLLIATGPQFRAGVVVPPMQNIHLYEMMARILGLKPAANDGARSATAGFFR
jgi:predicted AlkP superfamily pyrophosphatase or phosphodiesterase